MCIYNSFNCLVPSLFSNYEFAEDISSLHFFLYTARWRHRAFFFDFQRTFLADRTNGRAYATVLRLSVVCTECIVAKRCVLEQVTRKSYMRNRLVPK